MTSPRKHNGRGRKSNPPSRREETGATLTQERSEQESEAKRLAQSLQIHQVELEMQNRALRDAQSELESSRNRYATLFDFAPVGHVSLNPSGTILEANLTLASMVQVDRGELIGKPFSRLVAGKDIALFLSLVAGCQEQTTKRSGELALRRKDEAPLYVQLIIEPAITEGSRTLMAAIIDITERRLSEDATRRAEAQLSIALDAATMMGWTHDLVAKQVVQTANADAILGTKPGVPCRVHLEALQQIHPEDAVRYRSVIDDAVRARTSYVVQYRFRRPSDGSQIWLEERGKYLEGTERASGSLAGVLFDVTDLRAAEEQSMADLARLQALIEEATECVALLRGDGTVDCISRAALSLMGLTREEVLGKPVASFIHPEDLKVAIPRQRVAFGPDERQYGLARIRVTGGHFSWMDIEVSPLLPESSNRGYLVRFSKLPL